MKNNITLLLRLIAAGILIQTLYFKFTAAPESVYIFSTLGVEPYGRLFAGASEAVASLLLLIPATQVIGALMSLGIMAGAILSHLFVLGIVVQNDNGLLFGLACVVVACCLIITYIRRNQLIDIVKRAQLLLTAKAN